MPDIRFDQYYRYDALSALLYAFAARHPALMRLASIGKSHEGRDIWLATLTAFAHGDDRDKPAFWVDGNIHAPELAGSTACLYFIHELLSGYGHDPDISRCLDSRVFYICPRVNPDGAEWALAEPPRIIRSGTRSYPHDEEPVRGLIREDIDGDGRILSMRIADPDGPWKISAQDARLLVPREPAETGGEYYRLLPEGRLENYDGHLIHTPPPAQGLDLNRNFPAKWREESQQTGAGPYPASEPEVQNLVRFIADHPNICGGVAFHCYSGVLLRPLSYQSDEDLPAEDLWVYRKIGDQGTALTGYPAASAYHEFRYHPKEIITGAMDDWLYEQQGVFAWTVEIWSPQRQAGIGDYRYIDWYREHPVEDDLKLLKWNDEALNGAGFVPWYPVDHPQLGRVELGGWDPLFTFWNPPPALLEQEIARFPKWLVWHALLSPRLEWHDLSATAVGNDLYLIRAVVRNSGWLPSYVTKLAAEKKLVRGVICELELPNGARLLQGERRMEIGQLEGRAHKPSSTFGWAGSVSDPTLHRAKAEWLVQAPAGAVITVRARHARAGALSAELSLCP
ncbi:MAG: M14 family metallopeptidase [Pseudomonadota bacterium]